MDISFLHKGRNNKLQQFLSEQGIEERIVQAFNEVPRHLFLDPALASHAYRDIALPILCNQTISRPLTVALQTTLLQVQKGDKIMEIGTGSAFQSMILAALSARVYTIERHKKLFEQAKKHPLNQRYGHRIRYFYGNGFLGLRVHQPFDKIIVTAGANNLPYELLNQLKEGGIMVIPVGGKQQEMLRIRKIDGKPHIEKCGMFSFVPMVEDARQA